jgi:hypothetical protein
MESGRLFTVDEVARRLGVSARWLADQCQAERVEHVHLVRQCRFTDAQVDALVVSYPVRPGAEVDLDATRRGVVGSRCVSTNPTVGGLVSADVPLVQIATINTN